MQLSEVIQIYYNLNIKRGNIFINNNKIIITDLDKNYSKYFININKIQNLGLNENELNKIKELCKLIKIEKMYFDYDETSLKITNNKFRCELVNYYEVIKEKDRFYSEDHIDLEDFEFVGMLNNLQIKKMLFDYKILKIQQNRGGLDYYYITNKYSNITNKYVILKNRTNLKDCIIDCDYLKEFVNESEVNIFKKNNIYVLKSKNRNLKYIPDFSIEIKKIIEDLSFKNELVLSLNLELPNLKFLKNGNILNFDLRKKKLIIKKGDSEIEYNLNCLQLDYDFSVNYTYFKMLNIKENKININLCIDPNIIRMNTHFIYGIDTSENNIEFTDDNINKIQKQINEFENNFTDLENEIIEKSAKKIIKKVSVVKNKIVLKSKKRVTEVDELTNFEIVKYVESNKLIPQISKIEVNNKFDLIEFIYINNFTELENSDFYNVNYKKSKLYLEFCELTFNLLKNKIEVLELNVNLENHFHYFNNYKDLLDFTRAKILTGL